jgi:hypothetical protein
LQLIDGDFERRNIVAVRTFLDGCEGDEIEEMTFPSESGSQEGSPDHRS